MSTDSTPGFADLGLDASVLAAIKDVGYETPSPIQLGAIPPLLAGRDLLGQAQTGTGKTAAFALPLLSRMDMSLAEPQLLVLAPTRELALQVAEAMQTYARHLKGFHVLPVYGGQGMDHQLRQLRRGVHAIVGTPGRIKDHLNRGTLKLNNLRAVVLDEADEMLRMGFIDDVEEILGYMPEQKQVALFSATMPERIKRIADRYLNNPALVRIQSKTSTVSTISQYFWQVQGVHKLDALTRILEVEDIDAMLVFVRTRTATVDLAEKLEARGFASAALSGEMNQLHRQRTVDQLKSGKLDIVVATDVAARGLDVDRISHVVNFDIPYDAEAYVHRIGRTGRAGRPGKAILFVAPRERRMLGTIERATRQPIERMTLPTREDIVDRRSAQFGQSITEAMESQDLDFFKQVIARYQEEHDASDEDVMAALAYLAQKDRPLMPPVTAADTRQESWKPGSTRGEPRHERFERAARGEREARPARAERSERRPREEGPPGEGVTRYRIAVGHEHGVEPRNIVGAIANEAGLDAEHIGRIRIHDSYSTVDLPEGMPRAIFEQLKKAWVLGQQLNITAVGEGDEVEASRDAEPGATTRPQVKRDGKPQSRPFKAGEGERKPRSKPAASRDTERKPRGKPAGERSGNTSERRPGKPSGDRPRSAPSDRPAGPDGKSRGKPAGKFPPRAGSGSKTGARTKPASRPAAKAPGKPKVKYTPKPANKFGGKNSKPPGRKVLTTKKS
jgi:ATP-dependent RNA helicase DeaD